MQIYATLEEVKDYMQIADNETDAKLRTILDFINATFSDLLQDIEPDNRLKFGACFWLSELFYSIGNKYVGNEGGLSVLSEDSMPKLVKNLIDEYKGGVEEEDRGVVMLL